MNLWNIGHVQGQVFSFHFRDIPAIKDDLSSSQGQQPCDAFQKRCFSNAIGTQNTDYLPSSDGEVNILKYIRCIRIIGKPSFIDLQDHDHPRDPFLRRIAKNGAPIVAVKMPRGISTEVRFLAMSSIIRR